MRLSDLLGLDVLDVLDVLDASGEYIGSVVDLRLIQDGPVIGPYGSAFGYPASSSSSTGIFAFSDTKRPVGPWFIRGLVHRLTGRVSFISWDDVDSIGEHVRARGLRGSHKELARLPGRNAPADL